ncbi:MAG: tRNA 4-thiouridine(8) synthase ThiI [Armatimonadetes bacterium]|nr:tRNA 4-thiouridine(8) synthase ThiI [Armatimonadota bacterium]
MLLQEQIFTSEFDRWLKISWDGFVVHYDEIGTKGGNRKAFTKAFCRNLQRALIGFDAKVQNLFDHLLVFVPQDKFLEALLSAAKVFGTAYVAPVRILPQSVDEAIKAAVQTYNLLASEKETFAIRVRRVDKTFPFTSQELESLMGQRVVDMTGALVNLSEPNILISFRIYPDRIYQMGPKIQGVGGLPVGVTGKVLALISGGIDSPISAWLIMRRGCSVDFLHFHAMPNNEEAAAGKVRDLIEKIVTPQGTSTRLLLIPYHTFQLALLMSKVPQPLELVLFRRFMLKVANRIAKEKGLQGIVTGDSLCQVASQTMENLAVIDNASELPIFRPLLTYDKREIITLAQKIGTYELSIQPYKDCCSLIARHPETKAKLSEVIEAEKLLPIERLIEISLSEMAVLNIGEDKARKPSP